MSTGTAVRGRTGQKCEVSGEYRFDGYVDGTNYPPPRAEEMREPIARGNTFPPIRSSNKGCYWLLVRRI